MQAWGEYRADTDPTDAWSVLTLVAQELDDGFVRIRWRSRPSRVYDVVAGTNLTAGWISPPLTSGVPGDASGTNEYRGATPAQSPVYYRIRVRDP
jgi:hypothetical protein